jgi:hypothetical protein
MIGAAFRTEILLPETPHLFRRPAWTLSGDVTRFLAAEYMPATAYVRIDRLIDPSEFGADLINARPRSRRFVTPARSAFFEDVMPDSGFFSVPLQWRGILSRSSIILRRHIHFDVMHPHLPCESLSSVGSPIVSQPWGRLPVNLFPYFYLVVRLRKIG